MRIAAFILGIIGSTAGFIGALRFLFVDTAWDPELGGAAFGGAELGGGGEVVTLGIGALLISIVAVVGASLAKSKPGLAAALMAASAIVGFILVFTAYIPASVVLLAAAILAFLGRDKRQWAA